MDALLNSDHIGEPQAEKGSRVKAQSQKSSRFAGLTDSELAEIIQQYGCGLVRSSGTEEARKAQLQTIRRFVACCRRRIKESRSESGLGLRRVVIGNGS
jgi:hypothetical protein